MLDIQNKLNHHSLIRYVTALCAEQTTCILDNGPLGSEEDESTAAHSDTECKPSPTPCDVEEVVTAAGKTQLSYVVVEEVETVR